MSVPVPTASVESEVDELLEHFTPRLTEPMARRDALRELALAAAFVAACVAVIVLVDSENAWSWPTVLALVVSYAIAGRVQFQAGAGYTVPTQLVFVPMLFAAPLEAAPLLVALGYLAGDLLDILRGRLHPAKAVLRINDAWHTLGAVVVLAAAGAHHPEWSDWPIYVGALAAQFAVDFAIAALRERFAIGATPWAILHVLVWVWLVDALLAPTGLLAAFATEDHQLAFLLVLPLPVALGVFAQERRRRLAQAIELRAAHAEVERRDLMRREALEINDNVVQHLAVATYMLARGETEPARELVDRSLVEGKRIIGELLDDDAGPGTMRRSDAAR